MSAADEAFTLVDAPITAVQVYRQGATVTRTLTLTAPLPERLEVAGLPLCLSPPSARLRRVDDGGGDVVIAGVHVALHARPRAEAPEAPTAAALRDARRALQRTIHAHAQIQDEIALLSQIEAPPRPEGEDGRPPPASPMAARVALERFTHESISGRLAELRALSQEMDRQREEVAALEDQLRRSTEADKLRPDELSYAVQARLHADTSAASVTLELDYFVPGARWAPSYQCLIDRERGQVTLQMRAAVVQRTGEDWSDVAVRFSTAAPVQRSRLPSLSSIRIGKAQPPPPSGRGFRPPPRGGASLFSDYDGARKRLSALIGPAPRLTAAAPQVAPLGFIRASDLYEPPELGLGKGAVVGGYGGGRGDGGGGMTEVDEEAFDDFAAEAPVMAASALSGRLPSPAPPPPRAMKKSSAPRRRRRSMVAEEKERSIATRDIDSLDLEEEEEAEDALGLPRFSELWLPSPTDGSGRGRLMPQTPERQHRAALRRAAARADFDIGGLIREHTAAAQGVSLPGGMTAAASVQGRFDYAYPAENRLDIPGDGAVHAVPVLRWEGPCQVRYVLVPRVEPLAYRQAEIANPADAPLLPGPVEVYVDGQYAVTAELPLVGAGGTLELGLGAEQAIRCARNARFQERRSGEKVVAMTELIHDVSVELVNTLPRPARCEVRERIPQPAPGAEVVVDEEAVSPEWEPYDQRERGTKIVGGRRWQVTLPPGEALTLSARYVVKIYANNELVGGNRREA